MAELEKAENGEVELSFKEQLDKLIDVVVKIYGKQFTAKDIRNRHMRLTHLKHYKNKYNSLLMVNKTRKQKVYSEHQLNKLKRRINLQWHVEEFG